MAMKTTRLEDWLMDDFPALTFRDGVTGRRAALRDGPDVWEVAMVARDYADDRVGLCAHFAGFVDASALDQALAYCERFPDEISSMLNENARAERLLGGGE